MNPERERRERGSHVEEWAGFVDSGVADDDRRDDQA
jgi:hypothetical protein